MRSAATTSAGKPASKRSANGGIATNPFAEFAASAPPTAAAAAAASKPKLKRAAASSSSGGGWMTTKKRGRDDAAIEKDKRAAVAARKTQNGRKHAAGAKGGNNNKKKSKKRTAKVRKRYSDSESEDSFDGYDDVSSEEDMDDFIVDDDEEVEQQSMSSATEDEINSPPPLPSRRAAALRASKRLVEEKKADDDEGGVFDGGKGGSSEDDYSKTNTDDDDDEEDGIDALDALPSLKKHKSAAAEALSTTSKYFSVPRKKLAGGKTSSAPPSFRRGIFDSSDESSENSSDDAASCGRETKTTKLNYNSNDSDRNGNGGKMSPEKPLGFRSKKDNGKKFLKKRDKNSSTWVNAVADARYGDHEDDFMDSDDDDEQIALGLALSESLMKENSDGMAGRKKKLGGAKKAARKKKDKQKKRRRVTVELSPLSSSDPAPIGSDEDDDDGQIEEILAEDSEVDDDEVDVYEEVNEAEREAEKVLKVANDLSRKVLVTMKAWSPNHAASADELTDDGKVFVPEGMIVDDALALSTLPQLDVHHDTSNTSVSSTTAAAAMAAGDNASGPSKHKWISHEDMQEICPGLKLADFQLIGVNWLALLHSMDCDVEGIGDKKNKRGEIGQKMNVNGVLADEMGCGKTVQTIAFLAWLKHRNTSSAVAPAASSSEVDSGIANDEVIVIGDSDSECDNVSNSGEASQSVTAKAKCESPTMPHIIIVPASVLSNWQREFTKFSPSMKVVKYHGSMQEREELQQEMNAKYLSKKGRKAKEQLDVVLTTFSYFSKEKSDDRSFLRKFNFNYMVVSLSLLGHLHHS